jgi:hypothetical protein
MDFVSDALADRRKIRMLTVLDAHTRECLKIEVDTSLPGARVGRALEELKAQRGLLEQILTDNGPEFSGRAMDAWAYAREVGLRFIEPGKPSRNGYIESFNEKLRDECLNENWLMSLSEARRIIEVFRQDYSQNRPHSSLGNQTPEEFAREAPRGHPYGAAWRRAPSTRASAQRSSSTAWGRWSAWPPPRCAPTPRPGRPTRPTPPDPTRPPRPIAKGAGSWKQKTSCASISRLWTSKTGGYSQLVLPKWRAIFRFGSVLPGTGLTDEMRRHEHASGAT